MDHRVSSLERRGSRGELAVELANGVKVAGDMEAWIFAILNALTPEQFESVVAFVRHAPRPMYVAVPSNGGA